MSTICCDIDGTFLNTMSATYLSYKHAMHEEGYALHWWAFDLFIWSRSWTEAQSLLNLTPEAAARIHKRKTELFKTFAGSFAPNIGLVNALTGLMAEGNRLVFTTSGSKEATDIKLNGLDPLWADVPRYTGMRKHDPACWDDVPGESLFVIDDSTDVLETARLNRRVKHTQLWAAPMTIEHEVYDVSRVWLELFGQKTPAFVLKDGFFQSNNGYGYCPALKTIYKGTV